MLGKKMYIVNQQKNRQLEALLIDEAALQRREIRALRFDPNQFAANVSNKTSDQQCLSRASCSEHQAVPPQRDKWILNLVAPAVKPQ